MIALLSLLPGSSLPGSSLFDIPHFDKVVHCSMYALFGFVALIESRCTRQCYGYHVLLLMAIFFLSALIEILQATVVESRGAEWYDLLANFIGLGGGYLAFRLVGSTRLFRFLRS
ncbi:MAG: VanZ family protein [Desulfobacteraceae bacterium]|nr:VanZ family protein [Desulfobacteraceae bacterium]